MVDATGVEGRCDERFVGVRDAFERNFLEHGDVGASVCVVLDGEPVVDLWGGWAEDAAVLVFSTTKGLTATCALLQWERGRLDLDAPIAEVWPEFAAAGKEGVTARQLLAHRAGLPAFDGPISVGECHDAIAVADRLAAQAPRWEPGTAHGYHMLTFGWLVGELVRRVDGRPVGQVLADDVARPLGLDLWLGLPPEAEARVSPLLAPGPEQLEAMAATMLDDPLIAAVLDPSSLTNAVLSWPPVLGSVDAFNSPALWRAAWPSAGAIATARALATFYGELACDRLLSPATLDQAQRPHSSGVDLVLRHETAFGLGFMVPSPWVTLGPGTQGFGHNGAGGSLAFADRRAGLGFAYTMNRLGLSLGDDPRSAALVRAVYAALGET